MVEEIEGLKFVYDRGLSPHMEGKMIDYRDGPSGGFSVNEWNIGKNYGECC
ncbi:MAG TPA: hypothetical protein VLH18_00990 [Candidatus Limnocylindrales bacterium]|nr:hypothetical protein [Candidatus Limnocylindrales bacterium]